MNNLNVKTIPITSNFSLVINSDLLIYPKRNYYIAHQCNCQGVYGGLAGAIVAKFPATKVIDKRALRIGTCSLDWTDKVINMYAQKHTGLADEINDTKEYRLSWFRFCLAEIRTHLHSLPKDTPIKGVAFPWKIGCNLAGGNWKDYFNLIWEFANSVDKRFEILVVRKYD